MSVIEVTAQSKVAFNDLALEGDSQQERFDALIADYTRLKGLDDITPSGDHLGGYRGKEWATADALGDIPDEVLFQRDGTWQGESLEGSPSVALRRVRRLYDLLSEINSHLPSGAAQIEISQARMRMMLNSHSYLLRQAWFDLNLVTRRGNDYSLDELEALEKKFLPGTFSVFEALKTWR